MPVLTYITGYCCYSVCKKLQCKACKTKATSPLGNVRNIDNALIYFVTRGGLQYFLSDVVHIVKVNYIIVNKLAKTGDSKLAPSQRQLNVRTAMSVLD